MECNLVIIGGGPAGLAAAVYAGRAELKTILLERSVVGGQVAQTMDIANYPGFPEGVDGQDLSAKMRAQAERFGVEFRQAEAQTIKKDGDEFVIETRNEPLRACTVIIATGADPRKLDIPGEEDLRGRGVSYCGTCDGPFFRDRRVVVVGGGDSALKESLHLTKFVRELTIVHRRDTFRAESIYQKQVRQTDKISVKWNTIVTSINGEKKVESVTLENTESGEAEERETDGVFIFIGSTPNTSLICDMVPSGCGGHVETDLDMMTKVPGLFAVGDVRKHSYRQIATAVGEGATAAMAAEHFLQNRNG